jgi:acyl-coenzyme A synthetase/AMP-(fatty) acid ligase
VAVQLGYRAETVIALLGVVKAGKIRLAIADGTPTARRREILKHAEARVLITGFDASVPNEELRGIEVIDWTEILRETHVADPEVEVGDDALAAVYYTSGSTGRPKGVVVGHSDAVSGARSTDCGVLLVPDDRVGQVSDLSFAVSRGADLALISGASLHLYDTRAGGPHTPHVQAAAAALCAALGDV